MPAGKTYENIGQTTSITSTTTSVTFSNISQNYTDLILVGNVVASTGATAVAFRANGLSGSTDYGWGWISNSSNNKKSGYEPNQTYGGLSWYTTPGTSTGFSFVAHFNNYSSTSVRKSYYSRTASLASGTSYPGTELITGVVKTTNAITSIELQMQFGSVTFSDGTTFTLYGVKAA